MKSWILFYLDFSRSKLFDRILNLELLELWSNPDDQEMVDFNSIARNFWLPASIFHHFSLSVDNEPVGRAKAKKSIRLCDNDGGKDIDHRKVNT